MISLEEQRFVWDDRKAHANERKHGIAFKSAATVFRDQLAIMSHDGRHDGPGDRWHVVGMAEGGIVAVVVCEFDEVNGDERVRIISARKATLRERRAYETGEYVVREPIGEYSVIQQKRQSEEDIDMKAEYDFSNGVRGKFAHVRLPAYIDNSILGYFHQRAIASGMSGDDLINDVLRQHVAAAGYVAPSFGRRP